MDRSDERASLFASIILSLVEGEFISAAELGNVAQVCKLLLAKETRENDDIWAALCTRQFPCTHRFTASFKEQTSYFCLYKRWSAPVVKRQRTDPPLDPPACSESDLTFFFNVKYDGKSILSKGFNGDELTHLWKGGGIGEQLTQPIVLGKAEWAFSQHERALYEEREYECCLPKVHPRVDVEGPPTPAMQAPFDFQRGQTEGKLLYANAISQEQLPFKESRASLQILRRLPYRIHFGCGMYFGVVEGDSFAITSVAVFALKRDTLTGILGQFKSDEKAEKHGGVTLLHIISELEGSP